MRFLFLFIAVDNMTVFVHVPVCARVTLVDMWSVGCIFGEVIRGTVLFPGTDRILLTVSLTVLNMRDIPQSP